MAVDKSNRFVAIRDLSVVDSDCSATRNWGGKIWINEDSQWHGIEKGDLWLKQSTGDFPNEQRTVSFEEADDFKTIRGRLPVFNDYTEIAKYECWQEDKEQNGYVDLRRIDSDYSPSYLRKLMLGCAVETEKRMEVIGGDYRVEIIVHEGAHRKLENSTPGLQELTEGSYRLLEEIDRNTRLYEMPEKGRLFSTGDELIKSSSRLMIIHETTAMSAEQDRCDLDEDHQKYSESLRMTLLISNWIKGNYTASMLVENQHRIDSHDAATIMLLFGSKVVNTNSNSLIDFNEVAKMYSKHDQFLEGSVRLEELVLMAIIEKGETMLQGGRVFVDIEERNKIVELIKPLLSGEIEKTNRQLRVLANEASNFEMFKVLAEETLTLTDEIDLLNSKVIK